MAWDKSINHAGDYSVLRLLMGPGPLNILLIGDSYVQQTAGDRMSDGYIRSLDLPMGIGGFWASCGSASGIHNWQPKYSSIADPATRGLKDVGAAGEHLFGDLYHGVPIGKVLEYEAGHFDGFGVIGLILGASDRFEQFSLNENNIQAGTIPDWLTDNANIICRLGYYLSASPTSGAYITTLQVNNNVTGASNGDDVTGLLDPTDSNNVEGTLSDPGLNVLDVDIPIVQNGSDHRLMLIGDPTEWEQNTQLWLALAGFRITGIGGRFQMGSLGESSWKLADFASDITPASGTKGMESADVQDALNAFFPDKTAPLVIIYQFDPEGTAKATQKTNVTDIYDRFKTEWEAVGGCNQVKGLLMGCWRNTNDANSQTQQEVYWETSQENNNLFFISIYSLTDGILLDNTNTGGDQSAWAARVGQDAILLQDATTLDNSARVMVDGVHPVDPRDSFSFGHLTFNAMKSAGNPVAVI